MIFHNTEFHETKRERKYYEGKKQKALREIDHTIEGMSRVYSKMDMVYARMKLNKVRKLVNDI